MSHEHDPVPILIPYGSAPKQEQKITEPEEPAPEAPPEPVEEDRFQTEIESIKQSASPAIKDTIKRADCFGVGFYIDSLEIDDSEGDQGGVCDQMDCDLRSLCHTVYCRATGEDPLEVFEYALEEPDYYESIPEKRSQKKKAKKKKNTYFNVRMTDPYINLGRPVDLLALKIWQMVGSPPAIDTGWTYPAARTDEQLKIAKAKFTRKWGEGLVVCQRISYHQYFLNGVHWMRFWTRTHTGGWLDVNPIMAKVIFRHKEFKLHETYKRPDGTANKSFRFYPYRIHIEARRHLTRLKHVLIDLEMLSDDYGGSDED